MDERDLITYSVQTSCLVVAKIKCCEFSATLVQKHGCCCFKQAKALAYLTKGQQAGVARALGSMKSVSELSARLDGEDPFAIVTHWMFLLRLQVTLDLRGETVRMIE